MILGDSNCHYRAGHFISTICPIRYDFVPRSSEDYSTLRHIKLFMRFKENVRNKISVGVLNFELAYFGVEKLPLEQFLEYFKLHTRGMWSVLESIILLELSTIFLFQILAYK